MLKVFKPITSSQRSLKLINYKFFNLVNKKLKECSKSIHRSYGRNNTGRITSFHKGGGHKRIYRYLNKRPFKNYAIVEGLEYDPFRNTILIRIYNKFMKKFYYQIAPLNIKIGDIIRFTLKKRLNLKLGHTTLLKKMPMGSIIHNISFNYLNKTHLACSAGTYAQLLQKTTKYCLIRLKSGKLRYFSPNSFGTIGRVNILDYNLICLGKAGRNRWLNFRPIVRGIAMNPIDHPHGGGAGKTTAGRPSVSPWGKLTKGGFKTRIKYKKNYFL